jgi:hypothetical protein
MFVAVRAVPEAVQLADHPWVKPCPLGSVTVRVHAVIGSPVLVTVRLAVYPPVVGDSVQGLVETATWQDAAANAGSVVTTAKPEATRVPAAMATSPRRPGRLRVSLMPVSSFAVRDDTPSRGERTMAWKRSHGKGNFTDQSDYLAKSMKRSRSATDR